MKTDPTGGKLFHVARQMDRLTAMFATLQTYPKRQWSMILTLRLLMSYIYGAPSKARNANVVYIWTYVWQR